MSELRERVLQMFRDMRKDALDLHVLFEVGGNDPKERAQVLDAIEELVRVGLLEARGSDFYALTAKGKRAVGTS